MSNKFTIHIDYRELPAHPNTPEVGYLRLYGFEGNTYILDSSGKMIRVDEYIEGDNPLFVQDTQPVTDRDKYIWIQTNINGNPDDFTFWFEDGQ